MSTPVDPTVLAAAASSDRQILLLMLLGQVCSQHSSSPHLFITHVLNLYEKGLIDEEALEFLSDMGVVGDLPKLPPPPAIQGKGGDTIPPPAPSSSTTSPTRVNSIVPVTTAHSRRLEIASLIRDQIGGSEDVDDESSPSPTAAANSLLPKSTEAAAAVGEPPPLTLSRYAGIGNAKRGGRE